MLTRTTLRIDSNLKKAAEEEALNEDTTLQAVFNSALEEYLNKKAKIKAENIIFKSHDLGEPLDNLSRTDYYPSL